MKSIHTFLYKIAVFSPDMTPDQKAWFGKSQVVDANGKPLRVFHGTPDPSFQRLEPGKRPSTGHEAAGIGLWFSSDPAVSSNFAVQNGVEYYQREKDGKPENVLEYRPESTWVPEKINDPDPERETYFRNKDRVGSVFPCYLKMENPMIYANGDGFEEMMDDRDQFACYIDKQRGQAPRGHWRKRMCAQDAAGTNKLYVEHLKSLGHDGIIIRNTQWDAVNKQPHDCFVAWTADQIRPVFT